jgi:hypothetical protein
MRICKEHWAKIRAAIKERDIAHLGAKSGEEAMEDVKADLDGRERDYDPLMDCNWMINGRALTEGGLYLMTAKEDGSHFCPICEAIAHKPADAEVQWVEDYWIQGPADAALKECQDKGLVPKVQ